MKNSKFSTRQRGSLKLVDLILFGTLVFFIGVLYTLNGKERAAFDEASSVSSERWTSLLSRAENDGQRAFLNHIKKECEPFRKPVLKAETYVRDETECVSRKTLEVLAHSYANQADPKTVWEMEAAISRQFSPAYDSN